MTDSPRTLTPSLLATVSSLRSHLVAAFPPSASSASTHLLSAVPPPQLDHLRSHLTETVKTLRTSLNAFGSLLPDANADGPPSSTQSSRLELDKFLSVSLQSAATESLLLSLGSTPSLASAVPRARRYPALQPDELARASLVVLPILERIAKDLGLVCFRDDDEDESAQDGSKAKGLREEVTLSLGGKVMVVDVKVHRRAVASTEPPETGLKESVASVKVAYVFKGEQYFDEKSAKQLSQLFSKCRESDNVEADLSEELWSQIGQVLKELHDLDERTAREEVNYFSKLGQLVERVESQFTPISESSLSLPGTPALFPSLSSLYPLVLLDVSPSAMLYPVTKALLAGLPHNVSPNLLESFLEVPGVYAATFEFAAASASAVGEANQCSEWWRMRIISPGRGVPSSSLVGRRLEQQLGSKVPQAMGGSTDLQMNDAPIVTLPGAEASRNGDSRGTARRRDKTMADLFSSASWSSPNRRSQTTEVSDSVTHSHTVSFGSSSNRGPSGPHSFKFRIDDESHRSSRRQRAFLLDSLWLSSTATGEGDRGPNVNCLPDAVAILKEQFRINDLVSSVVNPDTRDQDSVEHDRLRRSGAADSQKRRKLEGSNDDNTTSGLDAFSHDSRPMPLPVFIHLDTDTVPTEKPSLVLSFPTPHLAPHEASPMSIAVSASATGYSVRVQSKLESVRDKLEKAGNGERVLELTRDLGLYMRWIVKTLS